MTISMIDPSVIAGHDRAILYHMLRDKLHGETLECILFY